MKRRDVYVADVDDDGELNNKYRHKKWNAKRNGRRCLLSYGEYVLLVRDAGIKSSDIGPGRYHLARYGDQGNYEIGNCRFIPHHENAAEMVPNPAAISAALKKYYADHPGSFLGRRHAEESKRRIGDANAVAQLGARNSQHGTCWVTDGVASRKLSRADLESGLPDGWRRGRTL